MEDLSNTEYIRQRISPRPGDPAYLHLSDLLLALHEAIPKNAAHVLDYGCGGSPYRPLFNAQVYHRADLAGDASLDLEYGEDSKLLVDEEYYDCVLSSQVLEHVSSPENYLNECRRVLKPEGTLVLSTHGLFEDHGCPNDFWRWTASGLQKLVRSAGFEVTVAKKLTTGPRAAIFFAERAGFAPSRISTALYNLFPLLALLALRRMGDRRRHRFCDACFPLHRVACASEEGHGMYVAILLVARRHAHRSTVA
jgi:SAM-dependent methyltransferase